MNVNRQKVLLTGTAIVMSACLTVQGAQTAASKKQPNILLIITDQQHARMMSCTGNKWLKTLALDALGADGMRFEKAYATNPVCAPSRISMATGMMPCRLGSDDNMTFKRVKEIPPEVVENSTGKTMKRAGDDCFYGGKAHVFKFLERYTAGVYNEYYENKMGPVHEVAAAIIKKKAGQALFRCGITRQPARHLLS